MKEPTIEEIKELVFFERDDNGKLQVGIVNGDIGLVRGNVIGVYGNVSVVGGNVRIVSGNVNDVYGDVKGKVYGKLLNKN